MKFSLKSVRENRQEKMSKGAEEWIMNPFKDGKSPSRLM